MNVLFRPLLLLPLLMSACASRPPEVPYPAFIQADDLPDVFLAALPGIRAKQFAGNPQSRRSSNRLQLPANWSGSTGGSPLKSVEIYVLTGEVTLGDLPLAPGGYAWLPAGMSGVNLQTKQGATLLWFLDDANPASVIGTPYISSSEITDWQPGARPGLREKELRRDPGSGARTWLLDVTPEARVPWSSASNVVEGYLLSGDTRDSECIAGEAVTANYLPGGYFHRPAGAVHGGPAAVALQPSVWLLRIAGPTTVNELSGCVAPAAP